MKMVYVGTVTTTSNINVATFSMKPGINLVYVTATKVGGSTGGDFVFGSSTTEWRTLNEWYRFTVTDDSASERIMPGTGYSTTYNGLAVIILNFPL